MSTTEPRLWDRLEKLLESDWTYPPYLDNLLDTILPIIEADREQALLEQATYFEQKYIDALEAKDREIELLQAQNASAKVTYIWPEEPGRDFRFPDKDGK